MAFLQWQNAWKQYGIFKAWFCCFQQPDTYISCSYWCEAIGLFGKLFLYLLSYIWPFEVCVLRRTQLLYYIAVRVNSSPTFTNMVCLCSLANSVITSFICEHCGAHGAWKWTTVRDLKGRNENELSRNLDHRLWDLNLGRIVPGKYTSEANPCRTELLVAFYTVMWRKLIILTWSKDKKIKNTTSVVMTNHRNHECLQE